MEKIELDNGRIVLYHGDCLKIMPTLESACAGSVIADPPYGTTQCKWDSVLPLDAVWSNLNRIIAKNRAIVLFCVQPFTTTLIASNIKNFKYDWVWSKNAGGNPGVIKYQPNRTHESIAVFSNATHIYNPQKELSISAQAIKNAKSGKIIRRSASKSNHITVSKGMTDGVWNEYVYPRSVQKFDVVPRAKGSKHPTQKPVALMEYLIKTYTNEDDLVLDFTMGSGTTGVAAINTNRRFIGIEKEEKYFRIAVDRMREALEKRG